MAYAEHTTVPIERSKNEIERLLRDAGATGFSSGWGPESSFIMFGYEAESQKRLVKFVLPLPSLKEVRFWRVARNGRSGTYYTHERFGYGRWRTPAQADEVLRQEERRRWRALALVVKAKMEAVVTGVATFENEFMAHIMMPDGKTVAEHARPWIEDAYGTGKVKQLAEFSG